ncbi:MAG: EamA family transporter [Hyphomicrobiaceae bacterium]
MGEWIVELAGTPAGRHLALALVLFSALAHAVFGAINKGGIDPFINRGAINLCYSLIAFPFALFAVPWPTPEVWLVLALAFVVHIVYEYLQASSFRKGAFVLVYPIARGTSPLVTFLAAWVVFHESLSPGQALGGVVLSGAIFGLAAVSIRTVAPATSALKDLRMAVIFAVATGVMISAYTTVDAFGVRAAVNPFTFLIWFFAVGGLGFPVIALFHWRRATVRPTISALAVRGIAGALVAYLSFGSIMIATRLDSVGKAAALRETSIIFAALIGVFVFRERMDARRFGLIGLIAVGAVLVQFG